MNPMAPPAPVTTPNVFVGRQGQPPVDYNDAISYVNKIKNRFQSQPDKYKQFQEILLPAYQKEQQNMKDGASSNQLTEHEVYNQVAKLFENQEDLLQEFGYYFLPEVMPSPLPLPVSCVGTAGPNQTLVKDVDVPVVETEKPKAPRQEYNTVAPAVQQPTPKPISSTPRRSLASGQAAPSTKKVKHTSVFKDISLAEAGKYGTLNDFAFFDKVRHLLRSQHVYDNFLRVLLLFNEEVFSKSEVLQLVTPFLSQAPELLASFKEILGYNNQASSQQYEPVQSVSKQDKLTEIQVLEIVTDFSTCKRLGTSYCAVPKNHTPDKCSGRTSLCREVLNDDWVSFSTWSEDSTFVISKKVEEYSYRCEDERFELDIVIETNAETIRCLEVVVKKMSRMSPEELQVFQIDDCLGGTSQTIHQQAIRRLYGEKASDIIERLQKLPMITVPMVLKRLKAKNEEWMEAQKEFNKVWREQFERFYLKSLDSQGTNFKQRNIRVLRSNSMIAGNDAINDEDQEQNAVETATNSQPYDGHHLNLPYGDRSVLNDACSLLLHHIRRQSSVQKEDKRKVQKILENVVSDLFRHPRMEMSDEGPPSPDEHDRRSPLKFLMNGSKGGKRNGPVTRNNGSKSKKDEKTENNEVGPSGACKGQVSRRTIVRRELI